MSNLTETRKLPEERRNEIATRALIYMKIRNGFRINFLENIEENNKKLAEKIKCSVEELKKFTKEAILIIFQRYCEVMHIVKPDFNYQPDESEEWIKLRNQIGFNFFIHESTKHSVHLHFRPDSEPKKAELCRAYKCNDEELNFFAEEITHLILNKAFEMY